MICNRCGKKYHTYSSCQNPKCKDKRAYPNRIGPTRQEGFLFWPKHFHYHWTWTNFKD